MKTLHDLIAEITSKTVLVRCNYDVPIEDGNIQDTTRIEDSLETIHALLNYGCKVVLLAHAGRPEGKVVPELSLRPVASQLETYLGETVAFLDTIDAQMVANCPARIVMIENLRFWSGEEANDEAFAKQLATCGSAYVNEAFANCHRAHASVVGLPKLLPYAAGLHLEREISILHKIRTNPEHPLVVVIGGAKVETKEPLVRVFKGVADYILVGGKIAQELHAGENEIPGLRVAELTPDGKDVTEKSAREFADLIMQAKSVVWNGTMGMYEDPAYKKGTEIVGNAVCATPAFTLVGGGDTEAALTEMDLEQGIDHISTGGGAMLDFLAEGTLVGIEALGWKK